MLSRHEFCENWVIHSFLIYCPVWVKFCVRELRKCCEGGSFVKISTRKAVLTLWVQTKLHLCVYCKIAQHLESKECLVKVCVLHQRVLDLQSYYLAECSEICVAVSCLLLLLNSAFFLKSFHFLLTTVHCTL